MKALSIKQPWAWAIIHAGKRVENRDWPYPPKHRGPLLIHASKTFDHEGFDWIRLNAEKLGLHDLLFNENFRPGRFDMGGVIGIVDMVDCVRQYPSPWFFGPLGLVFEDPRPMRFFPCNGKLGIFEVPQIVTMEECSKHLKNS